MNAQTKTITVVNLGSKLINFNDRQTGESKSFTLYQIAGNDGITYETSDQPFFASRSVGETLEVTYEVISKISNGKTYTNYRLTTSNPGGGNAQSGPSPTAPSAGDGEVLKALRLVYADVQVIKGLLEIEALNQPEAKAEAVPTVDVDSPTPKFPAFEDDVEEGNAESQIAANETQAVEPPPTGMPF